MVKRRLVYYLIGIAIAYLVYTNLKIGYYNIRYAIEVRQLNKNIAQEKLVQQAFLNKLEHVKEAPFVEEKARTVLGLIKRGEVAYQVVDRKYERNK